MGAVTYPNDHVIQWVSGHFIPVKIDSSTGGRHFKSFNVQWTPTILIQDRDGQEHHRTTGFLSPEDFIVAIRLGLAKMAYNQRHFEEGSQAFRQILEAYPETSAAPEALYYQGVCEYMASQDSSHLNKTFEALREKYPKSDWTKKAEVWS
ncbi:MAG: hypothetical protein R3231_00530 [bacterium]|nr:hypothetical protein [bacterium]